MPLFTTPTQLQAMDDPLWGRYRVPVGITVIREGTHFVNLPGPTDDELRAAGVDGVDFFRGGYEYPVTPELGQQLIDDGYTVDMNAGYGYGEYGNKRYGE